MVPRQSSVSERAYHLLVVLMLQETKSCRVLPPSSFPFLEVKRKPQNNHQQPLAAKAGPDSAELTSEPRVCPDVHLAGAAALVGAGSLRVEEVGTQPVPVQAKQMLQRGATRPPRFVCVRSCRVYL